MYNEKDVERAKYSILIACPLIQYISFKLVQERTDVRIINTEQNKTGKVLFKIVF